MTSTFGMVRDAGLDTWSLSDHATKLASSAQITGRETKGHRRTFRFGAAGAKLAISNALSTRVARNEGAVADFAAGALPPPGAASPRPHREPRGRGSERD
eukprot:5817443-Prymnesium_polylepis.1